MVDVMIQHHISFGKGATSTCKLLELQLEDLAITHQSPKNEIN